MNQQEIFVQMGLGNWKLQLGRAEKAFDAFSDDDFNKTVAPGKNRIIYLYGHLAVVHDALKEILGLGKPSRPELAGPFLHKPDDPSAQYPSVAELKAYWAAVHTELNTLFATLTPAEWFHRHNSVSDEDFAKDPTRNKLNVLLNRAGHIAYHIGQVNLVKGS